MLTEDLLSQIGAAQPTEMIGTWQFAYWSQDPQDPSPQLNWHTYNIEQEGSRLVYKQQLDIELAAAAGDGQVLRLCTVSRSWARNLFLASPLVRLSYELALCLLSHSYMQGG